jgi:hypothetical protein
MILKTKIKQLLGAQEELLKTHEQECDNVTCTSHVVLRDRIRTLKTILSPAF